MKRCPSCGEENSDRARFCQACTTPLDADAPGAREVRKVVTVLFADVTGSTSLGERLDPESLRRVMERFFDTMKAEIERHGGVVEKFIGDAVMAVFGIPRLHEDDPIRAVRAAAAMGEALAALNRELEAERGVTLAIRTGVTTGEVVAGNPASGQRLVTGDTVNTAARLEQAAQPGEVLLGEPTYRLVRDAIEAEPAGALSVKGKAEPLPAYRLLRVQAGVDAHARHLDSPMVGRDRELRVLREALDRAVSERTCHLFTLLGPAGVGKSRLVLEFLDHVGVSTSTVRGRCLSYGEGITFFPVAEAVRESADIADTDSAEEARRKIEAAAAPTGLPEMVASTVAELIGMVAAPVTAEDAFWAVRTYFESLAQARPLILVFDDIHWGEPAFLDLVEHIADWTRDAPILLLCLARPELLDVRAGWAGGKLNATSILLEPLGSEQCSELIDHLLGTGSLPAAARSRILDAAEGNPLFVEEMLGMLVDDGLLRMEDGRWVASEEVVRVAVPPTIQLLLAARLDRLDAEERAVAERASVEGKVFHRGAVTRLSPDLERPLVRTRLLALARKELIRADRATFAGEDAFRFRHLLIRDAAYQGMPKEVRAQLHLQFAGWLAEQSGDRLAEYQDILGYHLEQAYRYRAELGPVDEEARTLGTRAAAALASAGRRAASRDDHHATAGFFRRALELTPDERPERTELGYELALQLYETSEFLAAKELAAEVIDEARQTGDRKSEARATALHALVATTLDPAFTTQDGLDQAAEAFRILEELGDEVGAIRSMSIVQFLTFVLGQVDEALSISRALLERAKRIRQLPEIRIAVRGITGALYYGSTPASEGLDEIERLLPLVSESPAATAEALHQQPGLLGMLGRFEEAKQAADRNVALMEQVGVRFRLAGLAFWNGPMHMLAGEYQEAERVLRNSIEMFEALGDKGFNSTLNVDLAEALLAQGRIEEAREHIERGRALSAEDDIVTQVGWRGAMAKVLATGGSIEEAERLAREAVELGEPTTYISIRGNQWLRLGEVLRLGGKNAEAADAVGQALALFERKGNVVMATRAREELASI